MNSKRIAKKGELLMVDCGEYSDYCLIGFFVVLDDFDVHDELEKHKQCDSSERASSQDSFLSGLIKKGYLLEIQYSNMYLGSYGGMDDFRYTSNSNEN